MFRVYESIPLLANSRFYALKELDLQPKSFHPNRFRLRKLAELTR